MLEEEHVLQPAIAAELELEAQETEEKRFEKAKIKEWLMIKKLSWAVVIAVVVNAVETVADVRSIIYNSVCVGK